jgi:hypothetical protein
MVAGGPSGFSDIARGASTPLLLIALVALVTLSGMLILPAAKQFALTEMLVMIVIAVGISIFISNTGIISFGHIGFTCLGAYATAWMTCDPMWKSLMLPDLPSFLADKQYPPVLAILLSGVWAAFIAAIFGGGYSPSFGNCGGNCNLRLSDNRLQRLFELERPYRRHELHHQHTHVHYSSYRGGLRRGGHHHRSSVPGLAHRPHAAGFQR